MKTSMPLALLVALAAGCGGDKNDTADTDTPTFDPGDTDTDADADADADADTDADSDADTDTDTDADTDADTGPTTDTALVSDTGDTGAPPVANLVVNPGFELDDGGAPPRPTSWLVFPPGLTHYATALDGEAIYGSGATFPAYGGAKGLKVYGGYTGGENTIPVYQEFDTSVLPEGTTLSASGWAYTATDDRVGPRNDATLLIRFIGGPPGYFNLGESRAAPLTQASAPDTWTRMEVPPIEVPPGTLVSQVVVEYRQCIGTGGAGGGCYDGGSAYFDDIALWAEAPPDTGPVVTSPPDDSGTLDTGLPPTSDTGPSVDTAPPTDTSAPADTGTVPTNLLRNPDFEVGTPGAPAPDWLVFPPGLANFPIAVTGEPIFGSGATFTAYSGVQALKVYGQFTGFPNDTPVYQEWVNPIPGTRYTFEAQAMSHGDDKLAGANQAFLAIRHFDAVFNLLQQDTSAVVNNASPDSTWIPLTASGVVPPNTFVTQAVMVLAQCPGIPGPGCYDGGSVYFDAASFYEDAP